jgi:hypothetical protein
MYLIYSFLFGYFFDWLQWLVGMNYGVEGVGYYAEVHTSFWNSLIHTFFMQFTMLGMWLWIPALFNLPPRVAERVRNWSAAFYVGLYGKINWVRCIMTCMIYTPMYIYSDYFYYTYFLRLNLLVTGLAFSVIALGIQESLGHYVGGDDPSRAEGVLNAILYAPYYSVTHFFE